MELLSLPHVDSGVQPDAAFHEQEDLLALAGFRHSATVHQLENVRLQNKNENKIKKSIRRWCLGIGKMEE